MTRKPGMVEFRTTYLRVEVDTTTGLATVYTVRTPKLLFREAAVPSGFGWAPAADEQFYGLGPRDQEALDIRGQTIATTRPLLLSSAGYGLFFGVPGAYHFELGKNPRVAGPLAQRLEYFFYYGPTPKEILTEHLGTVGSIAPLSPWYVDGSGRMPPYAPDLGIESLPQLARVLNHASFSAIMAPVIDVRKVPGPMAAFWPIINAPGLKERAPWVPYLYTYLKESRDRGLPMYRPLAMNYPEDKQAWTETRTFMIGDELLFSVGDKVYLPRGLWTNFCTGEQSKGRQAVPAPKAGCPMVHNGTIIPVVTAGEVMELHYYPRLGAEFFIAEPGFDLPSQVHASPAGDLLRLEIESLVDREYEWVVHQVSEPVPAPNADARYDRNTRTLRSRVKAKADSDVILNIQLTDPL
ncbi:MAG: hypothetical protein IT168_32040 [Bryobacterales bacterium]|nr:hypothetical protein [Bryobacterales bacterium]